MVLELVGSCKNINTVLEGIQQLLGHNFAIFDPPSPAWTFLYPQRGQKQTFFDPLLPRYIECPLKEISYLQVLGFSGAWQVMQGGSE